jgi:hypothetical protein
VSYDPDLTLERLVEVIDQVIADGVDDLDERQQARLAFLEANLPGAKIAELIQWPGEWFGNRWFEEVALTADEVAQHALERCGRELR